MRKLALLFAMTIVTTAMSFAQMEEGHIEYSIEMSSDDPEIAGMAAMFNGSKMNLYFSSDLARTELDFGSMMSISTVVNSKTEKVLMLMGGMMGNKAVLTTSDEIADGSEEDSEVTWTYSKETKKILDYKCKKAIATDAEGNEIAYWYTEKIKPAHTDETSALAQLPGLAMEYVVDREGMMMTFTASKLETSLDSATKKEKFSFEIPEGYTEMTYDEFSSMGM